MYENVGKKIQSLAKVLGWLMLAAGVILWFYFLTNSSEKKALTADDWLSWVCLILGALSFLSSWILYGFGQIVEDVHEMRHNRAETASEDEELPDL